jgi:hypothetical protein
MTATPGRSVWLVSDFIDRDLSDSQADSAGSIPITRSNQKPQVNGRAYAVGSIGGSTST